jgi:hypothetical protein
MHIDLGKDLVDKLIPEPALLLAKHVAARYSALPHVEAVALAGSHTTQVAESGSDIDLYIYWHAEIPLQVRRAIASVSATRVEVNNQFWEPGDEWIDEASGIHVDVMFRHTRWIEEQLERVLERHEASVGYSTCFWHNVSTSKPLFDKRGWFTTLQTKARQPYPEELRRRIIAKNHPILRDNLSSYLYQLKKAVRRCDKVSLNHRIAALLASYFDIIFAVNRLPHPGEKRILRIAESQCQELPEAMRDQVTKLLAAASGEGDLIGYANALIDSLDDLLERQRLYRSKKDTV